MLSNLHTNEFETITRNQNPAHEIMKEKKEGRTHKFIAKSFNSPERTEISPVNTCKDIPKFKIYNKLGYVGKMSVCVCVCLFVSSGINTGLAAE